MLSYYSVVLKLKHLNTHNRTIMESSAIASLSLPIYVSTSSTHKCRTEVDLVTAINFYSRFPFAGNNTIKYDLL